MDLIKTLKYSQEHNSKKEHKSNFFVELKFLFMHYGQLKIPIKKLETVGPRTLY